MRRIRYRQVEMLQMEKPANRIDLFSAEPYGGLAIRFMHGLMKSRDYIGRLASILYRFVACEVRGAMCASQDSCIG
jgi:hypothetical protein